MGTHLFSHCQEMVKCFATGGREHPQPRTAGKLSWSSKRIARGGSKGSHSPQQSRNLALISHILHGWPDQLLLCLSVCKKIRFIEMFRFIAMFSCSVV